MLRRNESTRREKERRRRDKLAKLHEQAQRRNAFVSESRKADPQAGLRSVSAWVRRHKVSAFVRVALHQCRLTLEVDPSARAAVALLDGCYVLETDVADTTMAAQTVYDRYLDLQEVERDFRTMKTGQLEVRPIFVRKAQRTRAHVFVTMLALKVVRELRRQLVKAFGTTHTDRRAVTLEEALTELGRLCLLKYETAGTAITGLPRPDERQVAILAALGTSLPTHSNLRQM